MQMVKGSSPFGRTKPNYLGSPLTDKSYPLLLIRLREVEDMKYRKRPVIVEAIEFLNERSIKGILQFMGQEVELNCARADEAFSDYCNTSAISNATGELRCAFNDLEGLKAALKVYESRMRV